MRKNADLLTVTAIAHSESCTLAPVCSIASGRPVASVIRWRFEAFFPRSVGFGPVFSPKSGSHRATVDHRPGEIDLADNSQLVEEYFPDLLPHGGLLPVAQLPRTRHTATATHLLWKIFPGSACLQNVTVATGASCAG